MADRDEIARQVGSVPLWWHSIDLGGGVVTPGRKSLELLQKELAALRLPDLQRRTVLDIGAWDGYFSFAAAFAAERLGAAQVTALDHFVWAIDWQKWADYRADCQARGVQPSDPDQLPELWQYESLPGKRGFDGSRSIPGISAFNLQLR